MTSVCIIDIIYLVVLGRLTHEDFTWNFVNSAIWSAAGPSMGVISACIPSLRPLVSLLLRGTVRGLGVSKYGSARRVSRSSDTSHSIWAGLPREDKYNTFTKLQDRVSDQEGRKCGHGVEVSGGRGGDRWAADQTSLEAMNIPQGVIQVKDEVVVTSTDWLDYKYKVF